LLFPALSGCVATSRELVDLRDDIYQLQLKLNEVQRNQADIASKMDSLSGSMNALNSELGDTRDRMSLLGQQLDDVEANFASRMNKLSEELSGSALKAAPPPSELYKLAYSDFSRGKFDLAMVGFKSYLEKYPQGGFADQAQYYIAESYYSLSEWASALQEFEQVETFYPKSSLMSSVRLRRALCLELLDRVEESKKVMESVIKDFPGTPEAHTAAEKLKTSKTHEK